MKVNGEANEEKFPKFVEYFHKIHHWYFLLPGNHIRDSEHGKPLKTPLQSTKISFSINYFSLVKIKKTTKQNLLY
jgi:hypothetical protein